VNVQHTKHNQPQTQASGQKGPPPSQGAAMDASEPEWLCFCIRKTSGTYDAPGGWELRAGRMGDSKVPTEHKFAPNLLSVVLGRIEAIVCGFRDMGATWH
jgi:hypothetical protein